MRAGPLRHRPTLLKPGRVQNRTGGFDDGWVDAGKLWAEITVPTGRIAVVAEQLQSLVDAEIRIRPRADVKAGCRLVHGTTTYLIEAALPDNELSMQRLLCSTVPTP
jgi:SPP1 family predicted phage head-tail adaptor